VLRLPRCLLAYQPPHAAPDVTVSPAADGPITFGSFNQRSKLSPATIALWSAVLRAVPDARLLLKAAGLADRDEAERLAQSFAAEGVTRERLVLLDRTSSFAEHLAAYGRMDIALDPLPYNGTTTTVEALWMGVPVLTLAGGTMVERMGASLLTAAGLAEWIADTPEAYVAKAVAFAADRPALAARRAGQRERLRNSQLCDSDGLATALEQAFRFMWRALLAGGTGRPG
jgi:predicted O-linked N-acetylglucosamine transferase (SPINDLY family)